MGFFQNIKNKLGIGGVSINLQVPDQVVRSSDNVEGIVTLTTKSEQEVKEITVKMIEEYSTGRGKEKKTKEFELGVVKFPTGFTINPGDTKDIHFTLPFSIQKSSNDELKEKGGMLGALGKVAAFATHEKSLFFIVAEADVKAAAIDPEDKKEIRLV